MLPLLVALGGALGVLARWGVSRLPMEAAAAPWATAGINVAGSFALGVLVAATAPGTLRDAVGVGFLGGFTTFSTFAVQVLQELDGGAPGRAAALVLVSVAGGVAAAAVGWSLGRALA